MTRRVGGIRTSRIAAATALLVALAACSSSNGGGGSGGTAAFGPGAPLHGNQLVYGVSAARDRAITYQPDVVFLDGGADSVKAVSADGMSWTISASAKNVDQLQVGKIMVATNYGVGRILAVAASGADKRVALGPVSLTDIIKDGTLASAQPIALAGFNAYDVSGQPGLITDLAGATTSSATTSSANMVSLPPARFMAYTGATPERAMLPAAPAPGNLPAATPTIPDSVVGDYHLQSSCCSSVGVHVYYEKNGGKVSASVHLRFDRPTVDFSIVVRGGQVKSANVSLHGAAGLSFDITAATLNGRGNFKGPRVELPVDIQIPIAAGPIPMTIGVQQIFSMGLALSGRAEMSADGEYTVGGSLGFSYANGAPKFDQPKIGVKKSILEGMGALSVGPSGLDLAYALKLSIGVGTIGFTVGAWYQVAASLALTASGAPGLALVNCKSAALTLTSRYGIGYNIPDLVASAVNALLSAIYTNPKPIKASGGPEWGPDELFKRATPPCSK